MASVPSLFETNFSWVYFITIASEEGRDWAREFRAEPHASLEEQMQQALSLLRQRRIGEGVDKLRRVEDALPASDSSAVASVLHHRYLAALAYAQYCREDFAAAERSLEDAQEEVRRGLEKHSFLMPIANQCSGFRLQRIRISRSQRLWEEMADRIEAVRKMLRDEEPLCTFSNGTPLSFGELARFYESIPSLGEVERAAIRTVYDPVLRLEQFERLAKTLYALPGFAIGYP